MKIKEQCRKLKVTFNDFLMAVLSVTLKQYFISQGDEKAEDLLAMIPFSIRGPPKDPKDFLFSN